jgi:hypothetical protein
MAKPPTLTECYRRNIVADDKHGVHTFSNGTDWECWASGNCLSCRFYDLDGSAGEHCGFEAAAMLHVVTPAMAVLFGWTQNPKYAAYQGAHDPVPGRHGWHAPDSCPFFLRRLDDDGNERPMPVAPDPLQLVLIADPTEPIAGIAPADIPTPHGARA